LKIRFLVDGMLGSLARKLRIFGFDVKYSKNEHDDELLNNCEEDYRILLTSDKELHNRAKKRNISSLLIIGENDEERIVNVFSSLRLPIDLIMRNILRCPLCNNILKKEKINENFKIPKNIKKRYKEFFICETCNKIYWHGSHWQSIKRLYQNICKKLQS
jgi:uncharacterized protein with PIN domain